MVHLNVTNHQRLRIGERGAASLLVILSMMLSITTTEAQQNAPSPLVPAPAWFGLEGVSLRPVGEFRHYVGSGAGVNTSLAVHFGHRRTIAIRAELSESNYGEEVRSIPNPLLPLELVTRYQVLSTHIGPQVTMPIGPVRIFLAGGAGFSRFATKTWVRVPGASDNQGASQTQFHRTSFLYVAEFGAMLPVLSIGEGLPLAIGFSTCYLHNGRVSYLKPGAIQVNPDTTVSMFPTTSQANIVHLRLGLVLGFGGTKPKEQSPRLARGSSTE